MNNTLHRLKDRISQWWRYRQPNFLQKRLLGLHTDVIDTEFTAYRLASEDSASYIIDNMRAIPNFKTDYDLHDWVARTQLDSHLLAKGTVLEFGVATGRTLNHFAHILKNNTVHGFDGFNGLPEDWTSRMPKGFFARKTLPKVLPNCQLVVGWFNQTLPGFKKTVLKNDPIALLHIDCDLYSSTVTVLNELKDNIVPRTIIVFDEYLNYPGWQLDEFRAWQEFVVANQIKYEYIGYVSRHQQVAIRIISIG